MEPDFAAAVDALRVARDVTVHHGAVMGLDAESRDDEMELVDENPVLVRRHLDRQTD